MILVIVALTTHRRRDANDQVFAASLLVREAKSVEGRKAVRKNVCVCVCVSSCVPPIRMCVCAREQLNAEKIGNLWMKEEMMEYKCESVAVGWRPRNLLTHMYIHIYVYMHTDAYAYALRMQICVHYICTENGVFDVENRNEFIGKRKSESFGKNLGKRKFFHFSKEFVFSIFMEFIA